MLFLIAEQVSYIESMILLSATVYLENIRKIRSKRKELV